MKVASTLLAVTLSVTAVSAFGLHTGTSNVVKNIAPFHKKAMVQPVDVHGNRLATGVVSVNMTRKMIERLRTRTTMQYTFWKLLRNGSAHRNCA
jgi:hypothetical protein